MSSKLISLRPDQNLLVPEFNGYKLSLETIPTLKQNFETPVDRALPTPDQYSLLYVKLFGLHNHLTYDRFNDTVYFIDKSWGINRAYIDHISENISVSSEAWKIPKHRDRIPGDYNTSLYFVTEKLAVVGDGTGVLHIIDTGFRNCDNTWQTVFSEEVIGPEKCFVIVDVVFKETCEKKDELHCILMSIEGDANERRSVLYWITLTFTDVWGCSVLREMKAKGSIEYCYLERTCDAVYVISDGGTKFTLDSENPIQIEEKVNQETAPIETVEVEKVETEEVAVEPQQQCPSTFNPQQVEECDFNNDSSSLFERLSCITHKSSHYVDISSHKVLFSCKLSEHNPPAISLRYDVDACLWQPLIENGEFLLKHEGTLHAFGYIEASKQQKKFSACAPNFSYSVICETSRHLFIYRQQQTVTSGQLRNRTTSKVILTVPQQQVVTLSENEILGICATNNTLYLLTEQYLIALKM